MRVPSLFLSHGAPSFALDPGPVGPRLRQVGRRLQALPDLRALLVVSPHWRTRGLSVGASAAPATIHDFFGFPAPLYDILYKAAGAPDLAVAIQKQVAAAGLAADLAPDQGLDHGIWSPLSIMLPDADLPVIPLSLPMGWGTTDALALGRALAPLRAQGIVIVGSGSLTHNLYDFQRSRDEAPQDYVRAFAQWAQDAVSAHDAEALANLRAAPHNQRAHPTDEHYLPLLIALGASAKGEPVEVIEGGIAHGALAMDGYIFGALPDGTKE